MSWPVFLLLGVFFIVFGALEAGMAGIAIAGGAVVLVSVFRLLLDRDFGEGLWAHRGDREQR